jgi:Zn-dependent peptidase ImmA (M78 family)
MLVRGFKTKCENISIEIRKKLDLKKSDPLSPEALAEYLGVYLVKPAGIEYLSDKSRMQLLRMDKNSWSAVTISYLGVDMIVYNPTHSKWRHSSDIMHELSHIILGHKPSQIVFLNPDTQIALRDYNQDLEEEATWLAGCLLLPREALLSVRRNRTSDREACHKYGVSVDLLTFRINKTGVNFQIKADGY